MTDKIAWTEKPIPSSGNVWHTAKTGGGTLTLRPSPDGTLARADFTLDPEPGLEAYPAWQAALDAEPTDSDRQIRLQAMRGQPGKLGHFATVEDAKELLGLAALLGGGEADLDQAGKLLGPCIKAPGTDGMLTLPLTVSMASSAETPAQSASRKLMSDALLTQLVTMTAGAALTPCGFTYKGSHEHPGQGRPIQTWSRPTKSGFFDAMADLDGGVHLVYQGRNAASRRELMHVRFSFNAMGGRIPLFWPSYVTPYAALLMAGRLAHAYEAAGRTGRERRNS